MWRSSGAVGERRGRRVIFILSKDFYTPARTILIWGFSVHFKRENIHKDQALSVRCKGRKKKAKKFK